MAKICSYRQEKIFIQQSATVTRVIEQHACKRYDMLLWTEDVNITEAYQHQMKMSAPASILCDNIELYTRSYLPSQDLSNELFFPYRIICYWGIELLLTIVPMLRQTVHCLRMVIFFTNTSLL